MITIAAIGTDYRGFMREHAETQRFLGICGLNAFNKANGFANLGYWVRTSAVGRGIASTAVGVVARFAFEELGVIRVEIVAAVGNRSSQRVAEKAGATREGVLRRRLPIGERHADAVMHSLIPEDLLPLNRSPSRS